MLSVAQRYDRTAAWLHWIIGAALLAQLAFGWCLDQFERGTPAKALAINLHKSTGLVIAVLVVARLLWRLAHRPPAYPAGLVAWQARAAQVGHAALYVCMIGMPLTGYLASNFSKHGIKFFNVLPLAPWGPDDKALYGLFNGSHDTLGLVFSVLVAGHILLALYHRQLAHDGVFERMSLGS
jgi:cytochrome b561